MATLDDLGDVGDELKRSKDEFLGILDFYDTHRADLMADVASRLQDITNPDGCSSCGVS